jgi:hypothetical protein
LSSSRTRYEWDRMKPDHAASSSRDSTLLFDARGDIPQGYRGTRAGMVYICLCKHVYAVAVRTFSQSRAARRLVVLAEELHFGRAAERLNVAQPALSQQIHRLEQQVGTPLYTRNSRLVELTDSGRAMLDPARAALRAGDQAERAEREASRTAAHPLTIGIYAVAPFAISAAVGLIAKNFDP